MAVHGDELEHIVEGARVGAAVLNDGEESLDVLAKSLATEQRLARLHPVLVACVRRACTQQILRCGTTLVKL